MAPLVRRLAAVVASTVLLVDTAEALRTAPRSPTLRTIPKMVQSFRRITEKAKFGNHEGVHVPKLSAITALLLNYMKRKPICYVFHPPSGIPNCTMNDQEKCTLTSMSRASPSTMVYPGGKTRCLNNSFPEFAFQVFPGDRDKLYILFDGGGAEWDALSTSVSAANKTHVWPHAAEGFLGRGKDHPSPFRDYTILFVQYCSGDLHSGDVTQQYTDVDKGPVKQMGYHNTMSVVNWALANMEPKLKSLVVSGVSAGAIAAEVWASKLLKTFKWESARIWADSYVPVFPKDFQGKIFHRLGVCGKDLLEGELLQACKKRTVNIEDVYEAAIKAHPEVGFGSVTSTEDFGQTVFYQLTALTELDPYESLTFTGRNFHRRACKILQRYSAQPNFVSFMIHSDIHILQMCPDAFKLYQEVNGTKSMFVDWMRSFLGSNASSPVGSVARIDSKGPKTCTKLLNEKSMLLAQQT